MQVNWNILAKTDGSIVIGIDRKSLNFPIIFPQGWSHGTYFHFTILALPFASCNILILKSQIWLVGKF